jgi:dihydrofolate reductase
LPIRKERVMGEIKVHEFVSLDGVYEDPRWTFPFGFTEALGRTLAELTAASTAILLGRRTWEAFAPAWSTRTVEDDPGAPFFNDTTKYVVSKSLTSTDAWQNSKAVGGYDPQVIRELKHDSSGAIYVSGSGTLVRALVADGLVDEIHLFVYPVVLGAGERLFPEGMPHTRLNLVGSDAFENGVLHLNYAPSTEE